MRMTITGVAVMTARTETSGAVNATRGKAKPSTEPYPSTIAASTIPAMSAARIAGARGSSRSLPSTYASSVPPIRTGAVPRAVNISTT